MGLPNEPGYTDPPDLTPRREGGGESLAVSNPIDPRNDEKVIDNRPGEAIPGPTTEDDDSSR